MKATLPPEADAPLLIPPWVPEPVAGAAREIHPVAGRRGVIACLVRLVRDERMQRVWYQLARRRRDGTFMHPAAMAPAWSAQPEATEVVPNPSEPDECQDVAMANLLRASLAYAIQSGTTLTRQQAEDDCRRYLAMARQLRTDASRLQLWIDPQITSDSDRRRLLASAASAARVYELVAARIANKLESSDPTSPYLPIIRKRSHRDAADQWLALAITGECRWLFGSPLYGVTAIIMSVILDREIAPRAVRQWCAHPADKPPKSTR
jgi:hypothetical protein